MSGSSQPERKSEPSYERPSTSVWFTPVLTWIAIIVMLGANAGNAFLPLGPVKPAVSFGIAAAQVLLVGLFFMRLNKSSNLVRLTAVAGFFWLLFLFTMSGADYFTRP